MKREPGGIERLASWLRERRRARAEADAYWSEQARLYDELVTRLQAEDRCSSYQAFYGENKARRGDDVLVCEVVDEGLRWNICWHPGTTEVAAFPAGWVDDQAHQILAGGYSGATEGQSGLDSTIVMTAPVPPLILVLGRAESADEARARIAEADGLAAIRRTLD